MKEGLQRRTAISIRGLTRRYPDKTVGNSAIDLDVYEGDVLSVLGPNGAGKTTLVRQITGELNPTSGSIKIKDVNPLLQPLNVKQLMGVIPQVGALFSHLTVQEHLYFFGRLKGLAKGSAGEQVERLIPLLSLEEYRGKKSRISREERRKGYSSRLLCSAIRRFWSWMNPRRAWIQPRAGMSGILSAR